MQNAPQQRTLQVVCARHRRAESDVAKYVGLTTPSSELCEQYGAWWHGVS
jgi:hypothetical protein